MTGSDSGSAAPPFDLRKSVAMATMMGDWHSFFLSFFFFRGEGVGYIGFSIFQILLAGRCSLISGFDLNFETIFLKDYSQGFRLTGYKECGSLFVKLGCMRTVGENTGVGIEKKCLTYEVTFISLATRCYFKGVIRLEMKIHCH